MDNTDIQDMTVEQCLQELKAMGVTLEEMAKVRENIETSGNTEGWLDVLKRSGLATTSRKGFTMNRKGLLFCRVLLQVNDPTGEKSETAPLDSAHRVH